MHKPVLVVDDDPDVLDTVKAVLENAGLTIRTATSGKGCLDELKKGFKGLILLDIMMPGMSGWEVVQAMIETGCVEGNIVCMFTARQTPDPILAEYNQFVRGYIRKPFEPQALISTVKEYLSYLN